MSQVTETPNGTTVRVVFETSALAAAFRSNNNALKEAIHNSIEGTDADKGPGNVVYMLVNTDLRVRILSEEDYPKWDANRNWGHSINLGAALAALFSFGHKSKTEFVGATDAEMRKYIGDNVADRVSLMAAMQKQCNLCPVSTQMCSDRLASFDLTAFEAKVAALR